MQELEKILEEIDEKTENMRKAFVNNENMPGYLLYKATMEEAKDVIRKHMNDGWIPVKKECPPFGKRLQATILHHEWISDYDSSWVPKEEKIHHAAYTEVCEIHPMGAMWCYACAEDDYHSDIAYIESAKDLSGPVAEIIAWRPLPDPYRPERRV